MIYNTNNLPDFYSVRSYDQIDYSFKGLKGKKCYTFFDNGFKSTIIDPNNRDIRFIWDGFLLFVDSDITLNDIKNGTNLYNSRLVALQRTRLNGEKANNYEVRKYILNKLMEEDIITQIMNDKQEVNGYPSKSDLWSTRDTSVLIDAIDCVGNGKAYLFQNTNFEFKISFPDSKLPELNYKHNNAIVLKSENSVAICRLISNNINLQTYLKQILNYNTFQLGESNNNAKTLTKNIRNF